MSDEQQILLGSVAKTEGRNPAPPLKFNKPAPTPPPPQKDNGDDKK